MKAEPFVRGLNFGEALRWHQGRFWYSDFFAQQVSSVAPDGVPRVELKLDDWPSGLGWLPDGRLLVVAMKSQRVLRREADGSLKLHADLKPYAQHHANDLVVDAHGHVFVGCFGFDIHAVIEAEGVAGLFAEPGPARAPLLMVDRDGRVKITSADHRFPNGMAIIGNTLIVAETLLPGFIAFDLGADGELGRRRIWAQLPKSPPSRVPDGICADSEGAIWFANALDGEALRIGEGGRILDRVETSQPAFACVLGGADGRELLIATAPDSHPIARSAESRGLLEIARVAVAR